MKLNLESLTLSLEYISIYGTDILLCTYTINIYTIIYSIIYIYNIFWNFQWKVAPALASGCCAVLKPSEYASLTCLELAKIVNDVGLPTGVLNIVTGNVKHAKLFNEFLFMGTDRMLFQKMAN